MTEISFAAAELLFALVWIICRAVVSAKKRKFDVKREGVLLLMYVNLAVILRFTFFPMETVNGKIQPLLFDSSEVFPLRVNLVPFMNITDYENRRDMLLNIIGNITMFIPSGIVLPIIYKRLDNFLKVFAAGAMLSLCIEILQLPFSTRASDIDDLILNTSGVVIGYGIYALVRGLKNRKKRPSHAVSAR
ncbi:VanZ family protein [Ruminococcus albus]|uniref:Glycopeptide antibiotics resistance protein n=1 Tax=Ruminococcus albus TaxID=1264 RepID=A0A1H7PFT0_RUMAL|nr:VanZ family protein [Ruminococcus albus]SEL34486.1 Glycopeptide antibiotics resistance protein [Ruminococcus albus]